MTRSQLFRHLVALLLLPNVTAWRYALPRGAKLPLDPLYWLTKAHMERVFMEQFEHSRKVMAAIRANYLFVVGNPARDFRIPLHFA